MANYIYKCPTCGATKEIIHRMTEEPVIWCIEGEDFHMATMHRVPQAFFVRWQEGVGPHQLEQNDPALMKYLSKAVVDQRRGEHQEINKK